MEIWKTIERYPGYQVSSEGRIKSLKGKTERILTASPRQTADYLQVCLTVDGRTTTKLVHQLVCTAFHGERPKGMVTRHLNGDSLDNRAVNLKWGTPQENAQDRKAQGGYGRKRSRLTDDEIIDAVTSFKAGESCYSIARRLGRARKTIDDLTNGRNNAKRVARLMEADCE